MSTEKEEIVFSMILDVAPTYNELRKIEAIVGRTLNLIKKFGFGENINQIIDGIGKINMAVRMLQVTVHAFEIATGPIGWIYAGVTAVSTIVTLMEMG